MDYTNVISLQRKGKKNPIEEWAKDMKPLIKEEMQMTRCLGKDIVSLDIRDVDTNFHLLIFKE